MKRVEIVSHLYGVELPLYVGAFKYHLSSLALHKPKRCEVRMTVHYCPTDVLASALLAWFKLNVAMNLCVVPEPDPLILGRRCIGRNLSALETTADLVWFADGDFMFGEGCLDTLAGLEWPADAALCFPRRYQIMREHAWGDAVCADPTPALVDLDYSPDRWQETGHSVAIGGIQIATGDFCRRWGYLNECPKWMVPHVRPFKDTLDDRAFRLYCEAKTGLKQRKIDLPNLFRIRQTVNARM